MSDSLHHCRAAPLGLALLAGLAAAAAAEPLLLSGQAVVESVRPGALAERTGLRAGDRIARLAGFDLPGFGQVLAVEEEWSKARDTTLVLIRSSRRLELRLPQGTRGWGLRPDWSEPGAERWSALSVAVAQQPGAGPRTELASLAEELDHEGHSDAALWLLGRGAEILQASQRWPEAEDLLGLMESRSREAGRFYWLVAALLARAEAASRQGEPGRASEALGRAAEIAEVHRPGLGLSHVLQAQAAFEGVRGNLDLARRLADRMLALRLELAPDSLDLADGFRCLSVLAWRAGDTQAFKDLVEKAFALRERLAPDSLDLAESLQGQGTYAAQQGQIDSGRALLERSLQIRRRLEPDSRLVARSLNGLGQVSCLEGDWPAARQLWREELELRRKLDPDGLDEAWCWNNLGWLSGNLGELREARELHLKALSIRERLLPDGPPVAYSLLNLTDVLLLQRDLEGARQYALRALDILQRSRQDSLDAAEAYERLGLIEQEEGRLDPAREALEKALAIRQREGPENGLTLETRYQLGVVLSSIGDLDAAEAQLASARDGIRRLTPQHPRVAWALDALGVVARLRGRFTEARQLQLEALELLQRSAPGSMPVVRVLDDLGDTERQAGRPEAALQRYREAADRLEAQRSSLVTEEARTLFSRRSAAVYHDLVSAQLALGDLAGALHTVERARARGLLDAMAEQGLDLEAKLPAALRERTEALRAKQRRIGWLLAQQSTEAASAAAGRWQSELAVLRTEQEALAVAAHREVPALAALAYPRPQQLEDLQQLLEPGTLLLAFSVGEQETHVLALLKGPAETLELRSSTAPLGTDDLAGRVAFLRGLAGRPEEAEARSEDWREPAAALYGFLLAPHEALLGRARRVLILPDCSLHLLPFALLLDAEGTPLCERVGLSVVPSMTLYARLRGRGPAGVPGPRWVGLGSPLYPGADEAASAPEALGELIRGGARLRPLPGALAELTAIRGLIGQGSEMYVGAEATERRARSLPRGAAVVHFACHGLLDDRFPMNSALVLSLQSLAPGPEEDGVLQAWEVFRELRFEAEMVVLSGCETGLGRLQAGEGLLGLARAFFVAGARSLLVSLWPVADRSAAVLMEELYRGLLEGLPKDEALARAQRRILRGADFEHPYHWAGFEVLGDPGPVGRLRQVRRGPWLLGGAFLLLGIVGLESVRVARGRSRRSPSLTGAPAPKPRLRARRGI